LDQSVKEINKQLKDAQSPKNLTSQGLHKGMNGETMS
jgi:hypothetical protein